VVYSLATGDNDTKWARVLAFAQQVLNIGDIGTNEFRRLMDCGSGNHGKFPKNTPLLCVKPYSQYEIPLFA
jgi:hypothetical protein